jgi:hypothetical protein
VKKWSILVKKLKIFVKNHKDFFKFSKILSKIIGGEPRRKFFRFGGGYSLGYATGCIPKNPVLAKRSIPGPRI